MSHGAARTIPPFIAWSHWARTPAAWQDRPGSEDADPFPTRR
jgi:hypothetical protein